MNPSSRLVHFLLPRTAPLLIATGLQLASPAPARSAETVTNAPPQRLSSLSLEDLMNIEVTSAAKKPERLAETAAAIYVITGEDIERSGFTTIPDALRMAPGLDVAQVDAHTWAVSSRGFNDTFANKLLVLMDGRSVYTPLYSGVYWEYQDTLLADVDRIEVIRGPGAALWGANAVNGVINIITKSARDTQGALVVVGGGSEDQGFGEARYGGRIGSNAWYRIYGKYSNIGDSDLSNGNEAHDSWWVGRGGFRVDWDATQDDLMTFQGDVYNGRMQQNFLQPGFITDIDIDGGNVLGRWTHRFDNGSETSFQTYYDRTSRRSKSINETRDTGDLDLQHRFPLGERQEWIAGVGYRVTGDTIGDGPTVSFSPDGRTLQLFSGFIQDEIAIVKERLRLTLGSKFDYNDFTGFEIQPSGRVLWTPQERHAVWAAVSRAVRTPSQAEWDVRINRALPPPAPAGATLQIRGNRDFDSEDVVAFELGYRVRATDRVSLDVATFYNVYDNLRSFEPTTPPPPPPVLAAAIETDNKMDGETYGVEVAGYWQVLDWWSLRANYTFLKIELHQSSGSVNPYLDSEKINEGASPQNQFSLRSSMNLPWNVTFDSMLRYVDRLGSLNVPSYIVGDARLAWHPSKNWEVAVVGQNLFSKSHQEFKPTFIATQPTEVEHSVYGKVTWRY